MYFVDVRRRGRAEDAVRVRPDLLRRHAHVAPSGDPADATTLPQGAGLPYLRKRGVCESLGDSPLTGVAAAAEPQSDRKSTRLNSSHGYISYAVFCLKKKNIDEPHRCTTVVSRPSRCSFQGFNSNGTP